MITVKISDQPFLLIPRRLSEVLSLKEGDQVEVVRQGAVLTLHKGPDFSAPKALRHLAGVVKSSRARGTVDIAAYMTRHGYEELDERSDP